MGKLINIDNGGTLTDICVLDGERVVHTKTLTTPYDLSQCLFEGLKKVSALVYGEERPGELLRDTDYIRYSTTQGTNALVERKGPRLGLIVDDAGATATLGAGPEQKDLLESLVADRVAAVDVSLDDAQLELAVTRGVSRLSSEGANRLVVSLSAADAGIEARVRRIVMRKFPSHFLGAIPVLFATDVTEDRDYARRTWTALFNAFLHPPMERFLYNAEHRLMAYKTRRPLLIFRNDGGSARVAKTTAVKTFSSGPRGGMEAVSALARAYGLPRVLSFDVGGTTTDVGLVDEGDISTNRRGRIQGVPVSFSLAQVESHGVGGSSIIRVENGAIVVGPESVGSTPGPACFGLGGTEATITDVLLLAGVLDPGSYFGGELQLDAQRAENAVRDKVAGPLGLDLEQALGRMESAWVNKIAEALNHHTDVREGTTLAAFGGAGPLAVTAVAEAAGAARVVIPGLAAVFSAYGIGFSDVSQEYQAGLSPPTQEALSEAWEKVLARAALDMFAEGAELDECSIEAQLWAGERDSETVAPLAQPPKIPEGMNGTRHATLAVRVVKPIAHVRFPVGRDDGNPDAVAGGRRRVLLGGGWREIPVYRLEDQPAGAVAQGPAIIEEAYFTGKVLPGWRLRFNANRDIVIERNMP